MTVTFIEKYIKIIKCMMNFNHLKVRKTMCFPRTNSPNSYMKILHNLYNDFSHEIERKYFNTLKI